ncbi:MAG: hypothetical protein ACE3JK_16625 [Sporolactobacillus sp.]
MEGKKSGEDDVLLTLVERKTRDTISQKINGKDPDSVDSAIKRLIDQFGPLFGCVFRTITADNGSEFSSLTNSLKDQEAQVYYTHPYTA